LKKRKFPTQAKTVNRWKIVDASGTKDDVHKKILEIIFQKIGILK